jgi:peptide subunit release factor RF-3
MLFGVPVSITSEIAKQRTFANILHRAAGKTTLTYR